MFIEDIPGSLAPKDIAIALRQRPGFFWLDASENRTEQGRFSFLGCEPTEVVCTTRNHPNPLVVLQELSASPARIKEFPLPRWVGFVSYDACLPLPSTKGNG